MTVAITNDTQPGSSQETFGFGGVANLPVNTGVGAAQWMSAGYLEAEYTFYAIQTTYETDLGLQVAPSTASRPAGGVDQNQIVRVRRPITFKIVTWTAQRLYVKPLLPHWNTRTNNEKLLKRTISARNPLQSLNHKTWEVSGQYTYAFKKEPFITVNGLEYFVLPTGKTTAENSKIPVALHAYTQGDFSLMPLNASWIPVDAALPGTSNTVGDFGRVISLDVPRQEAPAGMGPA